MDTNQCFSCRKAASMTEVKKTILEDSVPICGHCGGLVKPDIVFFGEMLPDRFHRLTHVDLDKTKLLICVGTSLEVYPFASIADNCPYDVPRVLINRDLVGSFGCRDRDYFLGGDLVESVRTLVELLGWNDDMSKYIQWWQFITLFTNSFKTFIQLSTIETNLTLVIVFS